MLTGSRLKRIGLSITFALFTAIGAGLAVFGTGGDRLMGVAVALMFGGGGLAWWAVNRARDRPMSGFAVGAVSDAGGREVAFVARSDKRILIAGVIGCFAFGSACLLMGLAPDRAARFDELEAALLVGGGVFIVGVGLFGLLRVTGDSTFALTRRGLHATGRAGWFVPWDAIAGMHELVVHDNPFLGIQVNDPEAIEVSRLQRVGHWLQRSTMGVDLSIPTRTLTVHPAELMSAIARYREHPEYRSRIGRADELALIHAAAPPEPPTALAAPGVGGRRWSIRRIVGIGALFLVGGLFLLVSLDVALDEGPPERAFPRLFAAVLLGSLALAQLAAAVLLIRNYLSGRRIAIGSTLGILALVLYGLARGRDLSTGLVLLALMGVHLLVVIIGARVARST